jgi:hypothetical protein
MDQTRMNMLRRLLLLLLPHLLHPLQYRNGMVLMEMSVFPA